MDAPELSHASFVGPTLTDRQSVSKLPAALGSLLLSTNGFIAFNGGLHVRGICDSPDWHSLHRVWNGDHAISRLYPAIPTDDIPFAEDFLGDQFLLRDGLAVRLYGETGQTEEMGMDLEVFLSSAFRDPEGFLSLSLLKEFNNEGVLLRPGELLNVYPPLCTKEAERGVSLKAIPALERIGFLADFARQITNISDGTSVRIAIR